MKKIQYSVSLYPNPLHEEDPAKAYASIQLTGTIDTADLAQHITEHNSVYSKGTIVGVLTELGVCIRELILQGYSVQLGDLGRFVLTITSVGAPTIKEFTVGNIEDMKVNFSAGKDLQNLRRDAKFEQTTTRRAQAATLAAQAEGKESADWSKPEDGDGDSGSGDSGSGDGD